MQIGFNLEKLINDFEDKLAVKKARAVFKCKACKQKLKHNAYNGACKHTDAVNSLKQKLSLMKIRLLTTKRREAFADIKQIPSCLYRSTLDCLSSIEYRKVGRVSLSFVLCLSLIIGCSISGFALDDAISPEKEEVIYVNLDADGSVDEIYVVNIFNLNEAGEIIDYGAYEEVRNMSSNDKIELENEKVTIYTEEQKLYYEGLIKGNALPWVFDIHYFLNDVELDAEDLGGKTGALRIELGITKNEESSLGFFENYCLQINLSLDTDNAKNIVAEGATIANVGSKKQITYIALPNQEHEYKITADVEKFTMSGFEINGLKMNVGLADIDSSVLSSDLKELEDGVIRLATGAAQLADGAGALSGGAADLVSGLNSLRSGVSALKDGASELQSGSALLKDGTYTLAQETSGITSLVQSRINSVSDYINDVLGGSPEVIREKMMQLVSQITPEKLADFLVANTDFKFIEKLLTQEDYSKDILEYLLDAVNEQIQITTDEDVLTMLKLIAFGLEYKLATVNDDLFAIIERYHNFLEQYGILIQYADSIIDAGGLNMVGEKISSLLASADQKYIESYRAVIKSFVNKLMTSNIYSTLVDFLVNNVSTMAGPVLQSLGELLSKDIEDISETLVSGLQSDIYALDSAVWSLYTGADKIYKGAVSLNEGLGQTLTGVDILNGGAKQLYDGSITLQENCIQMKNGSNELRLAICGDGQGNSSKIIKAIEEMFGSDFVAPSFTDERNESVNFVQFVLKTQSIVPPGLEEDNTIAQQTTFWTRFMKLFGVERREGAVND